MTIKLKVNNKTNKIIKYEKLIGICLWIRIFRSSVGTRHKGNVGLKPVGNRTDFVFDPTVEAYKYSKFVAYYITIPVMMEYQTRLGSKTFFINGGVEGMIKYASEAETKGKVTETFTGTELSVLPLNYRLSGRIGIGHLAVFGYYQPLSPLEKGPDIHPYGIGLLLGF
ncbi:hypothetical protein AGMMS49982_00240 [Bacteroidia bacterium]|nr:hypothetical protein AGMMS49982_00240 [Bacteroidia bacterium]